MAVTTDIVFRGRKAPTQGPVGCEPLLSVRDLTERFDECVADADLSSRIGPGEVFASFAPNGAGRTTSVRTPGTLISPTSGSATVVGITLTAANGAASRQLVAIRPESPGLYVRLSVAVCAAELRTAHPSKERRLGQPSPASPAPRRPEVRR